MRLAPLLLALSLTVPALAQAQSFVQPVEYIDGNTSTEVILADGSRIEGSVRMSMLGNGQLKSLVLKDGAGNKHKLKAADVKEVRNEINGLLKGLMVAASVKEQGAWNVDWENLLERNHAIWRQVRMPGKKDKRSLLQLLNPGFDARVQVFVDPSDDDGKSVYVVKDDGVAIKLKKNSYKKSGMASVFGDCEAAMAHPALAKARYKDLAAHTIVYDQLCAK